MEKSDDVSGSNQQPNKGDVGFKEGVEQNQQQPSSDQDVAQFVHTLLQQMQDRFQSMSDQILNRIDDMGTRIDDLEQNLNVLMNNAGIQPGMEGSQQQQGRKDPGDLCDSTQGNK